jgi:protein-L-isoaspartate(D-aspartate) O-methyltransferase
MAGYRSHIAIFKRCPAQVVLAGSVGVLLGLTLAEAPAQPRDRFEDVRNRMVDEFLVREGIKNQAVIRAMRTVPRHLFVPSNMQNQAYFDQAVAIGNKQTISPPFIVAYMTEVLDPQPRDRVLEIGTGSGYQAAVLSQIVADVYTIEIVDPLGKTAAKVLTRLDYANVHTRIGDGYLGWPQEAPFDKIIVTCSPEKVPQPLIEQLKEGGKLIVPEGERYEQTFYLYEKREGQLVKTRLLPALFVPMTGDAEKARQVLPDPKHPEINNGGFEIDNDGDGHPIGWHYQRQLTLERKGAPEGNAFVTFDNKDPGRGAMLLQGMGLDGQSISSVEISLQIRGADVRNRPSEGASAGLIIQFFDADRQTLKNPDVFIGPWNGTFDWKRVSKTITVPRKAREAIIRVGLNGAVGQLSIDDVRMTIQPRK